MKKYFLFLIIPLLLIITAIHLRNAHGAFWLGRNVDPDYVYLLNASNMADFKMVGHIDHPGTPLQLLGAAVLRITHFLSRTKNTLHDDVLYRPEFYLKTISSTLIILNSIMLLILGMAAYKLTQHIIFSLFIQLTPFLPADVLSGSLARVRPEPLLLFASLLFILLLIYVWWNGLTGNGPSAAFQKGYYPLWLGIIAGLGTATKVTFIPMLIIPLLIFPKLKPKLLYIGTTLMSFLLFTSPIWGAYPRFFDWALRLITRNGRYGTGKAEMISWKTFSSHVEIILKENPLLTCLLTGTIIIILLTLLIPGLRRKIFKQYYFKLMIGVALADTIGIIMVAKHTAQHYLLPVLSLNCFLILLIYHYLKDLADHFKIKYNYFNLGFGISTGAMLLLINPYTQITQTATAWKIAEKKSLAVYEKVQSDFKDHIKIYYYSSSAPESALKFGNDLSLNQHAASLKQIYPGVYFYDFINRRIYTFDYNEPIDLEKLQEQYLDKIVFQGPGGGLLRIPGMKLERVPVTKNDIECIFIPPKGQNAYAAMLEWIPSNVPKNSTLIAWPESQGIISRLQQDYHFIIPDLKKLNDRNLLNMSLCLNDSDLNDSYLIIPHETLTKDLFGLQGVIQIENAFPNETTPQYHIGRINRNSPTWSDFKKKTNLKEIRVWVPNASDLQSISPLMKPISVRGNFSFSFVTTPKGNHVTVGVTSKLKGSEPTFNIFGYRAEKNGLGLNLGKIDTVYMAVRVGVPEDLLNPDNHVFIQDYTTKWEREKVYLTRPGWMTYFISKKVRPGSSQLLMGVRFTPKNRDNKMAVKDIKIFISYK